MSEKTDAIPATLSSAPEANAPGEKASVVQIGQSAAGQEQAQAQAQPSQYQGNKQQGHQQQQFPQGGNASIHAGGHRQSYNAGGPGNKSHYNKRNNNYSGKGNQHHNGQHGSGNVNSHPSNKQQQQYGAYAYPQGMYGGNYYYAYPYSQAMIPGMQGVSGIPTNYPAQPPQPAQQFSTSPTVSKVKITDKDGKQVDWEEKSKSSSSTPKLASTPLATQSQPDASGSSTAATAIPAQPINNSTVTNTGSSPAAAPANASAAAATAARYAAAEEFRRKILERAQLAQKKKDEEKARVESNAKVQESDTSASTKVSAPVPAPILSSKPEDSESVEKPSEESVPEPPAKSAEQVDEKVPAASSEVLTEVPAESQVKESAKKVSSQSLVDEQSTTASTEALNEESKPVSETVPETSIETTSSAETPVQREDEAVKEKNRVHDDDQDSESKTESQGEEGTEHTDGEDHAHDDDDDHEHGEHDSVFDLSSFFERLQEAKPIENPFEFEYSYPSSGPDPRWKSAVKKYRYDPQFLLQFGEVQYPVDDAWKEKLEALGMVSGRRSPGGSSRMGSNRSGGQQGSRFNGSLPNRLGSQFNDRQNSRSGSRRRGGSANASNPRDRSSRNRTQSKRGKEPEEPPKPAEEVKPLVPSANRWVPRSRVKKEEVRLAPDGSEILEPEDVERKVNSALNKLTLEMFDTISEDLLKIGRQSVWEEDAKTIKQVISLTFAKACDEPYWSAVYAQFCAKMLKEFPDEVKDVTTITKTGEPAKGGDLARRILLATCQVEYEKGWVDKLPTNEDGSPLEPEMMSEEYYVMAAAKRRGLGLVKFIGNLYILNMLNDQVILHCLRDQSRNTEDPSEDSLENLAQLIRTVGPRFEAADRNKAILGMVYDQIQQILDKCKLSSRIKFMLMDLQDLRKSSWKAIKQEAGPKTIKEIHNAAELKKFQDQKSKSEKRGHNKGGFNNSGFGGGDSRSNSNRSGSSWGNKKDSRTPSKDSRGFTSVSRSQSNRNAPDAGSSSSNLGPRESSKRTDPAPSNIFAALGDV